MRIFKATITCSQADNDTRCERIAATNIEGAVEQVAEMLRASLLPVESVTIDDIHETPFMWKSIVVDDMMGRVSVKVGRQEKA